MFKRMRNTLIMISILYLLIGIIMLLYPARVSDLICYFVGIMFLFIGIAGIVMYVKDEVKTPFSSASLIISIIFGALGIYIILNPQKFASFIPLIIGIFLIFDSVSKLSSAFDLKKFGYSNWWGMLVVAFIVLVCGLVLIMNPFGAIQVTIMIIGSMLIFDAISNIFTIYSYSKINTDTDALIK